MSGIWFRRAGWFVWSIALFGPTLAMAAWSGEVVAELGMLLAILLIGLAHPAMTRLGVVVLLPCVILSPAVVAYVWQVGAMPGPDVLQSLRLTSWRELRELLADQGGVGMVGALFVCVASILFRPAAALSASWRQKGLAIGLVYLASGALHYSFLRDTLPFRPWVSQEVLTRTYPFSLVEPLMSVALAVPTGAALRYPVSVEVSPLRPDRQLVVLVIGESARADHWHINGYGRSTTPRLETLEGAQVYPHVRAVSDCTYTAVPALLKLMGARAYRDSGFGAGVPTMLDYFKAAGFSTAVVTMQEPRLMYEAGVVSDHTVAVHALNPDDAVLDEMILPEFRRVLAAPANRKFIVLHVFGSHFEYERRYPPAFARFGPADDRLARRVGYYDNSLLYTDWVLSELVGELRRRQGTPGQEQEILFAYVSDHGENLADDARGLLQHCGQPTHYDTRVATFFWGAHVHATDTWARVREHRDRYIGQEMIGATLLDLAGIRVTGSTFPLAPSLGGAINDQMSREVLTNHGFIAFDMQGRVTE